MQKPYKIALNHFFRDTMETVYNFQNIREFIRKNKLWEGVMTYTWLSKFLLVAGVIGGLAFLSFVYNYWSGVQLQNQFSVAALGSAIGGFFSEGYDLFVIGGLKYIILILMEVIIFHFARRTLEIKTGNKLDTSLKTFINAQIRMIKVVIFSFVMESIGSVIVSIIFSIIGFTFLKPIIILLIQAYFLGFAVVDNYNEIYHMTIKQSHKYTMQYGAVSLTIGLMVYVTMLLPLIGTVLGPLIGAVVATITMHELFLIDNNMAWVFLEPEKE